MLPGCQDAYIVLTCLVGPGLLFFFLFCCPSFTRPWHDVTWPSPRLTLHHHWIIFNLNSPADPCHSFSLYLSLLSLRFPTRILEHIRKFFLSRFIILWLSNFIQCSGSVLGNHRSNSRVSQVKVVVMRALAAEVTVVVKVNRTGRDYRCRGGGNRGAGQQLFPM